MLVGLAAVAGGCGGGGGGGNSVGPDPEPVNAAPTANVGEDQVADEGAIVTLTGRGEDRDGTIASYRWEQVSGPGVSLADPEAAATEFMVPAYASGEAELVFA